MFPHSIDNNLAKFQREDLEPVFVDFEYFSCGNCRVEPGGRSHAYIDLYIFERSTENRSSSIIQNFSIHRSLVLHVFGNTVFIRKSYISLCVDVGSFHEFLFSLSCSQV